MRTETQHLEQRVAALQSDLNERDQRIDELVAQLAERDTQLSACIAALREAGDYRSVASIEALSASAEPKCGKCGDSGVIDDKEIDQLPGDYFTERGLVACPDCEEPSAPVSSTSDKYKAELYDEVWQLARDMGFGNVTDALMKLQSQLQGKKSR